MSTTYNGDAALATGDTVAITVPSDGDPLNAASASVSTKKLADWAKRMWNIVGVIASTAWTWTQPHTFSGGIVVETRLDITAATNFTSSGKYYKDALGIVHLEGKMLTNSSVVSGDTVFTFPSGYRPPVECVFNVPFIDNGALPAVIAGGAGSATIYITTAGVVSILTSGDLDTALIFLDGISFRV